MRKDLSAIGLSLIVSGLAVLSSFAADPATVTLHGHVPAGVARGSAHLVGHLDPDTVLHLSIGLPVRNPETLEHLVQQVSDPASPNFRQFLTPQQFAQRFGPAEEDYQAVIAFAKRSGFTITAEHPNRIVLSLSARSKDLEKAFHLTLNRYQHPGEAREFFAPDREPTVDSALRILRIEGLDNFSIPRPFLKKEAQIVKSAGNTPVGTAQAAGKPAAGTGPIGSYQGSDFRNAYVPDTSLTGTGQNVDLVQFDGFFASDIAAYEAQIGLANGPNLVVVPIDGGVPTPGFNSAEVSLDIEMVLSMAPGVGTIYVYEAPNPSPWVDILSHMASDNNARQISSSWGNFGVDPVAQQIFQELAVQGQSFLQASGDSDAYPVGQQIPFPSDSPYITVVGGTTLRTGGNLAYSSETVWNWGIEFGFDGFGSSGGVSTIFSIPYWQTNINFGLNGASSTMRNLPDVALTADNVFVIYGGGQEGIFGGTSCAAPLWAGFTALVNEQAAKRGFAMGFMNPALYNIATTTNFNYNNCFHDIVTDNNEWSGSPTNFVAVTNYDLCTGLGTPNGVNLINALASQATVPIGHISPPPPPYGTNMAAVSGGNPNGAWSLFIQDDSSRNSGFISNGWILSLTLADIVGTTADLEMYLSMTNSAVFVGKPITFFLAVTNYGPSTSTNVQVIDTLPAGTTVVATNTTQGSVSRGGSTLLWNVGTLAVNAGAGLVLTVQPHDVGTFANSAQCQAGTPDPNPDDDLVLTNVSVITPNVTLKPSFAGSSNTFQINVPGPTNPTLTVVIQANSNLVSTNWVNVYTGVPPFIFNDPASNGRRFYRAQLFP